MVLQSGILTKSFVATGLTPGETYVFRVESQNSFGYSTYSSQIEVLCGFTPFAPAEPTSEVRASNVVIEWVEPAANGSPLLGYRIEIRQSDGVTFSEELTNCDGTVYAVKTNTACTIPLDSLTSAPFSLTMGMSVYVQVTAYNSYGDSQPSALGNGAIIVFVPDAPTDLINDILETNAFQIGLQWTAGLSNGGAEVAYYRVSYDQGIGSYTVLEAEVTGATSYIMTSPVTQGTTYAFKVEARNSVGFSLQSNEVSILAA